MFPVASTEGPVGVKLQVIPVTKFVIEPFSDSVKIVDNVPGAETLTVLDTCACNKTEQQKIIEIKAI